MRKHRLLIMMMSIAILIPSGLSARMYLTLDEAFPGFSSNDVGDIGVMYLPNGDTIIWVGTGRGISKTTDRGESWYFYDQRSGLNQNEISALTISGTTLWAAAAYNKEIQGELWPYGRGFNRSEDFGETWDSFIPFQVSKYAGMVCYDIAVDDTTVWATAWYGGLIRSRDEGQTWDNVFVDSAAQEDFEQERFRDYRNRFFAVAVDTLCPVEKKLKNWVHDIAYDGRLIWAATANGAWSSLDLGASWFPYDTTSGLNSNGAFCLAGDTSNFWVGLYEVDGTYPLPLLPSLIGADFNFTGDFGASWDTASPDLGQASSPGKYPRRMALADTVVWAACAEGGLIRSFDGGENWENVFADTSARRRFEEEALQYEDVFISLAIDTSTADTTLVWAGTRNGIYEFVYTTSDSADTVIQHLYEEVEGGSGVALPAGPAAIVSIEVQHYDSRTVVWAGAYHEVAADPYPVKWPVTYRSTDGGKTWIGSLENIQARDFAFSDSIAWVATHEGLKRSTDGGETWDTFEIVDSASKELIIPSQFTSVCVVETGTDKTIFAGTIDGLARSTDDGVTWEVTKFAQSFKKAVWAGTAAGIFKFIYNYRDTFDAALNYSSYFHGITGDWIVGLAVQEYQGRKVIWAATQITFSGNDGVSFSTDDGDSWQTTLLGDRAWNFAFDDTVVWTATSSGLKRSEDWAQNWDVFNFMKDRDEVTRNQISSTEFTSVAIIDGEVWAGNVDGLVKSKDDGSTWDVVRTAVPIGSPGSETAYAYPSPFSPILQGGQITRIRHRPREDGPVTVKIYDFAMDLVITVVDGEHRNGGAEYDEPWDGRNEKGDLVANGVYFFKVEAAGGQTEWGKVVVLK
jgi:hypothetical protein